MTMIRIEVEPCVDGSLHAAIVSVDGEFQVGAFEATPAKAVQMAVQSFRGRRVVRWSLAGRLRLAALEDAARSGYVEFT